MTLSPADWHNRFRQQAGWTEQIRQHLLAQLNLAPTSRVLEVGCGTGAVTAHLHDYAQYNVYGLDLNLAYLRLARQNDPVTHFTGANALQLPFSDGAFDAVVCHYFLLWIKQPEAALAEMVRVTRPGGAVIAFAEPDYGGRIDYPPSLAELGRLQTEALRSQGADPDTGRKLSSLFHAARLRDVETGLMGGQWRGSPSPDSLASEWATLAADLSVQIPPNHLHRLRQIDESAWQTGQRVLFVPTFYAMGRK